MLNGSMFDFSTPEARARLTDQVENALTKIDSQEQVDEIVNAVVVIANAAAYFVEIVVDAIWTMLVALEEHKINMMESVVDDGFSIPDENPLYGVPDDEELDENYDQSHAEFSDSERDEEFAFSDAYADLTEEEIAAMLEEPE